MVGAGDIGVVAANSSAVRCSAARAAITARVGTIGAGGVESILACHREMASGGTAKCGRGTRDARGAVGIGALRGSTRVAGSGRTGSGVAVLRALSLFWRMLPHPRLPWLDGVPHLECPIGGGGGVFGEGAEPRAGSDGLPLSVTERDSIGVSSERPRPRVHVHGKMRIHSGTWQYEAAQSSIPQ
jgi:hypothetical protein